MLNKKGQVGEGLSFLLKLLLFMFITGAAVYVFNNVALSDIRAQNSARDLGAAFDALALSTNEITLEAKCPSGVAFIVDGSRISATVDSLFGQGFASYSYLHESNAQLPSKKVIDCSSSDVTTVSKSYYSSLNPIIGVS